MMGWLPQVFRDAGFSAQTAGLLLALVIGAGVPIGAGHAVARRPPDRPAPAGAGARRGDAGRLRRPGRGAARGGALVWTALLAFGQGSFPLALALLGLRARTTAGTAALSAFAQSTGYLIAIAGPLSVGLLYHLTGGFVAAAGRCSGSPW